MRALWRCSFVLVLSCSSRDDDPRMIITTPDSGVCPELQQCNGACCGDGEICLRDACTPAGAECATHDMCGAEEYCEPLVGRCLPRGMSTCEYRPPAGAFAPEVEWEWPGWSENPDVKLVISTPAVGDVDRDGTPDILFIALGPDFSTGGFESVLLVLDGRTGAEKTVIRPPFTGFNPGAAPAIGDVRPDVPGLEIALVTGNPYSDPKGMGFLGPASLALYSATGALLFDAPLSTPTVEGPAPYLADVDADGSVEIGYGGQLFTRDGTRIVDAGDLGGVMMPGLPAMWAPLSTAGDLDGDGVQELVGSNRAVRMGGGELWRAPGAPIGFPAVADLDADRLPDVVFVEEGQIGARRGRDGSSIFGPIRHPGANLDYGVLLAGPPTVADFDGDGRPEIGAGSAMAYAVFDPDCQARPDPSGCETGRTDGILWSSPTIDHTGGVTASSVFDFEGDGRAEVLHNDECTLRVFDGRNGTVLWQTVNPTGTVTDYNLVVDVDADFNAEIVAVSNDMSGFGECGPPVAPVRVFGDRNDNWVPTRQIWNQHTYHITNVNDDGTIPARPEAASATHNSFRQNLLASGSAFDAPDLAVRSVTSVMRDCPELQIDAVIENVGSLGVGEGVLVGFFLDGAATAAATIPTTEVLLPGSTTTVTAIITLTPAQTDMTHTVEVRADADIGGTGHHNECQENNNRGNVGPVMCIPLG